MNKKLPIITFLALGYSSLFYSELAFANSASLNISSIEKPISALSEVTINGVNTSNGNRTLVVRVDDQDWAEYPNRANEERSVPPGQFSITIRLGLLQTPKGRAINPANLKKLIASGDDLNIDPLIFKEANQLPGKAIGWYFGPQEGAPLKGFQSIHPGDARVGGPLAKQQVRRPGTDPTLTYGMWMTQFEDTVPNGQYRISMWAEDPGEWENLPPVYERRIRVNKKDILFFRRSKEEWIQKRYLAGRSTEASPFESPFEALEAHRGSRVDGVIDIVDGKLHIEVAGYPAGALFVSTIVLYPADGVEDSGRKAVEASRSRAFKSAWPVIKEPENVKKVDALTLESQGGSQISGAPGELVKLTFNVFSPVDAGAILETSWDDVDRSLDIKSYWDMWRWGREGAGGHGLIYQNQHMRQDTDMIPLSPDMRREITILVKIPNEAKSGVYKGKIKLTSDGILDQSRGQVELPFSVNVIPVKLPNPTQKVGVFLDFHPAYAQDASLMDKARSQSVCDLDTLKWLGLTTVAPALELPNSKDGLRYFVNDYREAVKRFGAPMVAYVPLRRMSMIGAMDTASQAIAQADMAVADAGLPPVYWTVADEPHGAGPAMDKFINTLKEYAPDSLLASHLNSPLDKPFISKMNLVTINQGYGIDRSDVEDIQKQKVHAWFYNTGRFRLNAGFYLWASHAEGLLQWHARMPTADPFDPTDGREGDVQFLWPSPEICGHQDIDKSVLGLEEGASDLKWITWLEEKSHSDEEAKLLLSSIQARIGETWKQASLLQDSDLQKMREEIIALAVKK